MKKYLDIRRRMCNSCYAYITENQRFSETEFLKETHHVNIYCFGRDSCRASGNIYTQVMML